MDRNWLIAGAVIGGVLMLIIAPKARASTPSRLPTPTPNPSTMARESMMTESVPMATGFAARVARMSETQREQAVLAAAAANEVPAFLSQLVPVQLASPGHTATIYVAPDYFGIGTDAEWLRMPMYPQTAQAIADARNAVLPTRKIVNAIFAASQKLGFVAEPLAHTSIATYVKHHQAIEAARQGRTGLFAGHKKDIVITPALAAHPHHVAIYGAWFPNASHPIQGLNATRHSDHYADYSHGVRLIARRMMVDGQPADLLTVLADPILNVLVSDEGPVRPQKYPI
jgi:hypothetical protein